MHTQTITRSTHKVRNAIVGLAGLAVVGLALGHVAPSASAVDVQAARSQTVAVVTPAVRPHTPGATYSCVHLSLCG